MKDCYFMPCKFQKLVFINEIVNNFKKNEQLHEKNNFSMYCPNSYDKL